MHLRYCRVAFSLILSLYLAGCVTSPVSDDQAAERTATAGMFLFNVRFGELTMNEMRRSLSDMAMRNPSMAEVMHRVSASMSPAEFDQIGASIYAKHLNQEQLSQLLAFSETPTGRRFFKLVIESTIGGQPYDQDQLMSRFDPDELTEIMKFGMSDAALALKQRGPQINQELALEAKRLGDELFREYLDGFAVSQ